MARYKGPVCRLCRREQQKLFLKGERCYSEKCPVVQRGNPPGGQRRYSRRKSNYGIRLREKQKLKRMYGLMERQFRNYFQQANAQKGRTGSNLIKKLELRLDNIVYRLGFAPSRPAARQLVSHRHFKVNDRIINIPSYQLTSGDFIKVKEASKTLSLIHDSLGKKSGQEVVPWLQLDKPKLEGRITNIPTREDIPIDIKENLIVEFYSR